MFNETCPAGTVASDVGGDYPVCLTQSEWEAFETSQPKAPGVTVRPQAKDAWTNYLIYGALIFAALALFKR